LRGPFTIVLSDTCTWLHVYANRRAQELQILRVATSDAMGITRGGHMPMDMDMHMGMHMRM